MILAMNLSTAFWAACLLLMVIDFSLSEKTQYDGMTLLSSLSVLWES
jgi:hypothetical protein